MSKITHTTPLNFKKNQWFGIMFDYENDFSNSFNERVNEVSDSEYQMERVPFIFCVPFRDLSFRGLAFRVPFWLNYL
jgi:hypothetical protein